jgi:hypothetical protein
VRLLLTHNYKHFRALSVHADQVIELVPPPDLIFANSWPGNPCHTNPDGGSLVYERSDVVLNVRSRSMMIEAEETV